jgi:hypothetical protein
MDKTNMAFIHKEILLAIKASILPFETTRDGPGGHYIK